VNRLIELGETVRLHDVSRSHSQHR
jgi:hypothetical protein